MGTNYYLKAKDRCGHCGRGPDRGLHIGKSSGGWCFSLRVYPREQDQWDLLDHEVRVPIRDLPDWIPLIRERGVIDEYGDDVDADDMIERIAERSHPTGLQRHRIDGWHCIGNGDGTWDLMIGEFS